MRLIDADKLLNEIENGIKAGNYEEGYEEYPHINDMDDIIECIKYADSVKQEPKSGHWLYNNGAYKCEFCGHEITGREEDLQYCCKCGAKLESVIDNDTN